MKVGFVITAHRPLGKMTDQGVIGNFELSEIDTSAFLFLGVDLGFARVGNKVGFPNPLPVVGREITFVARLEIVLFGIVAIGAVVIARNNAGSSL